ncbi:TPA: DUF1372 family protein [Streptococcus suis]|nr:DUF1372 family protein [Streptococcus suis]HEL1839765.1 DUF1372 family protein [Streptococcus suis]HEL2027515.1 DUF1372 family protein [Streptococcus suis]HEL2475149.1 DUF1372 family protein [Streptococcus suis]HEP1838478.1 DUF1372 family protein [Streptococcus suis]
MVMLVLTFAISMSAIYKLQKQIEQLEARDPIIIYQVDNEGTEKFGKVTDKDVVDGHYYVEVKPYGKFLVTREQYEEIEIGQEMPEYLKGRGS